MMITTATRMGTRILTGLSYRRGVGVAEFFAVGTGSVDTPIVETG
jgi:hypothetical protein